MSTKGRILIIDDEKDIRTLLGRVISLEGYEVFQAENAKKGLKLLREQNAIHTVLCDVKLPDAYGVDLIPELKKAQPLCEIILLTAFGKIEDGVRAIKNGAFDYISKGDDNHKIIPLLAKATEKAKLQYKVRELEESSGQRFSFRQIVGQSKAMESVLRLARKVAKTDTTVLLTGETGTGKEVFAQAIHYESPRSAKPFVAINCSTLGKELLESELFGYLPGAFTGAQKQKTGLFEEAHTGTIFLDEIGEMDLQLQAKLLRVLETGSFIKLGSTKETAVDVRVIAATNRDLLKEVEAGRFRNDLYYRLSVFALHLPPLRERRDDIPLLAEYFALQTATRMKRKPYQMDERFLQLLIRHQWKGNVRELKNVIERAIILSEGDLLTADTLPLEFHYEDGHTPEHPLRIDQIEKEHIRKVLAYTKGNKTKTAQLLGIGLSTLYRKMEEYGIEK